MASRTEQVELDPIAALVRDVQKLKRELRELRASRRLESSSIGAGGLTVKGGRVVVRDDGVLEVLHPSGQVLARLGRLDATVLGFPAYGMQTFRSDDGSEAAVVYGSDVGGFYALKDRAGTIVLSDDGVSGQGLARPWLGSGGWFDANASPTATTTSGSFVTLCHQPWIKQHPLIETFYLVKTSDGSTAGEIRLVDDLGAQVGPAVPVPAGSWTYGSMEGALAGQFGLSTYLHLQARRTAGTGSVGVRGLSTWGRQS